MLSYGFFFFFFLTVRFLDCNLCFVACNLILMKLMVNKGMTWKLSEIYIRYWLILDLCRIQFLNCELKMVSVLLEGA